MAKLISIAAAARSAAATGVNARPKRQVTGNAETLLPPAIKGITLGFVAGLIAILCLMLFAPSLVRADQESMTEVPALSRH